MFRKRGLNGMQQVKAWEHNGKLYRDRGDALRAKTLDEIRRVMGSGWTVEDIANNAAELVSVLSEYVRDSE